MTQLIPMSPAAFETFMDISMLDHAQGQVEAGFWHPEEADDNMQKLRDQFLPQGQETPNHHFFTVQNSEDELVGGLWYMLAERDGKRLVFIVDIQIYAQFRRRGYGSQAFRLLEDRVRDLGITTIALNVFEHKRGARAMYEKLGYIGEGENMVKELEPAE